MGGVARSCSGREGVRVGGKGSLDFVSSQGTGHAIPCLARQSQRLTVVHVVWSDVPIGNFDGNARGLLVDGETLVLGNCIHGRDGSAARHGTATARAR